MKLLVVGGHTRNIGKTSLAASIIAATRELDWTALKITQYGHHICSTSGDACGCVVEDPEHPFAITPELDATSGTDTARLLQAGAREVYWVRTRSGDLDQAMPDLRKLLDGREYVLMESNSILRFLKPDLYISVLQYDADDFKRKGIHSVEGPLTLADLLQRATDHIPHHAHYIEEKRKALNIGERALPFHLASVGVRERLIA